MRAELPAVTAKRPRVDHGRPVSNRASRVEPKLAGLLHRISVELIRTPHPRLGGTIDRALAEFGEAAGADQALVAIRASGHLVLHHLWQRARRGLAAAGGCAMDDFLNRLEVRQVLVCADRKRLLSATGLNGQTLDSVASGIFVPLPGGATMKGVLAVTRRTPPPWPAKTVKAAERLAEMIAGSLDRMANPLLVVPEDSAREQAEAETRRLREQLAHAGRVSMLGELAASLAHELNQPLTAIYSNVQAAHSFLDRKPPALADALEALDDLGQDCRRAAEVLARLREMFRRHETERVPLQMGAIVHHVLRLLHEDAVARGVKIVLDVAPNVPLVKGDRVQLEQVVMNLLVNAFDALVPIKGERLVTVQIGSNRESVKVAVLDNGTGLRAEDVDRVFEAFFTRKPRGMGIGLAICRTIVEAHGGQIRARNRSEGGSTFEVSLPIAGAAGHIGNGT